MSLCAAPLVISSCSQEIKEPAKSLQPEKKNIMKKFTPCRPTPNCVSSLTDKNDTGHYIDPFTYGGTREKSKEVLLKAVKSFPRVKVTIDEDDYIRAEFTSLIFRFTDDVEFQFDDEKKIIHVKSASRVGRSDLGVNRKRVGEIRKKYLEYDRD
jgi:uncharacterized protein (DUF1499 family)